MRLTRQEDRSLYLYIRDRVLSPEYGELYEERTLIDQGDNKWNMEYEEDEAGINPFRRGDNSGLGRGLLYFDVVNNCCQLGSEQAEMVTVYDPPTELVRGVDYQVNYLTGQVYSTMDLSSFLVDYAFSYVSVLDAWPDDDVPELPIVSIEMQRSRDLPHHLGEAEGIRDASWHIEIFATDKGERDDLMDVLFEGIAHHRCPIYTFSGGTPLTREGTFNPNFVLENHANYPHLNFENVEKSLTGLPSWGFYETEVINKYRAAISFDTAAYKK